MLVKPSKEPVIAAHDDWAHVDEMAREIGGNVNLTQIERLFIESFKKGDYTHLHDIK